jgi:hypothetical protein
MRLQFIDTKVTRDPVRIRGQDPEDWMFEVRIRRSPDVRNPRGADVEADISRKGPGSEMCLRYGEV